MTPTKQLPLKADDIAYKSKVSLQPHISHAL